MGYKWKESEGKKRQVVCDLWFVVCLLFERVMGFREIPEYI